MRKKVKFSSVEKGISISPIKLLKTDSRWTGAQTINSSVSLWRTILSQRAKYMSRFLPAASLKNVSSWNSAFSISITQSTENCGEFLTNQNNQKYHRDRQVSTLHEIVASTSYQNPFKLLFRYIQIYKIFRIFCYIQEKSNTEKYFLLISTLYIARNNDRISFCITLDFIHYLCLLDLNNMSIYQIYKIYFVLHEIVESPGRQRKTRREYSRCSRLRFTRDTRVKRFAKTGSSLSSKNRERIARLVLVKAAILVLSYTNARIALWCKTRVELD